MNIYFVHRLNSHLVRHVLLQFNSARKHQVREIPRANTSLTNCTNIPILITLAENFASIRALNQIVSIPYKVLDFTSVQVNMLISRRIVIKGNCKYLERYLSIGRDALDA